MKKLLFLPILLFLTQSFVHGVFAADGSHLTQEVNHLTAVASKAADRQSAQLQNIIASADTMITNRITSLNVLLSRIQNDTRLSSDEKTSLTTQINSTITNLQTLRTKIDADTDVITARADRKSIVSSFHVYVTFEPQTRLLTIVENLQTSATTIQNLVALLQNLSTTLKGQGKDTTAIDGAIADISTQLTNITTLLTNDKNTLSAITVTNNTYQATFTQIRQDLAKVRADFATVQHDMTTIKTAVGGLFKTSKTLTPTLTGTTPTTTP